MAAEQAAGNLKPKDPTLGNVLGMAFAEVAPGSFQREGGGNVQITRPFWMGKFEVTQREYETLMGRNPSPFKGADLPVETVSWNDAVKFCEELTRRERAAGRLPAGYAYRLPTEAEWEYAARGGAKSRGYAYSGGNDLGAVGWFGDNSGNKTQRVGTKAANELGLHDLSGNVWEWCWDWYQDSYNGLGTTDPSGPATGSRRVGRGGSWCSVASGCRVAGCSNYAPSYANNNLGFRVCLAPSVQ